VEVSSNLDRSAKDELAEYRRLKPEDKVAARTELTWLHEIDALEEILVLIVLMLAPPLRLALELDRVMLVVLSPGGVPSSTTSGTTSSSRRGSE
jgi:hypothetical protein